MPNYGSLKDFVMSMGRELFASATRGYPALAKFAEEIGIDTKDVSSIASASDEAIQQVLDRGARQRIIDPRQANAIKIQMAKDAQEVAPDRSFVEGYEGNQVLPKVGGGEDPDYVYRTMSKKEYEDFINKGELVNVGGRTHASASPLNEFSNNVDDTVTVKIKYDRNDGWKAKMSSLGEVYAVTDQPISSEKISLEDGILSPNNLGVKR
jgi:hypothetical protein